MDYFLLFFDVRKFNVFIVGVGEVVVCKLEFIMKILVIVIVVVFWVCDMVKLFVNNEKVMFIECEF